MIFHIQTKQVQWCLEIHRKVKVQDVTLTEAQTEYNTSGMLVG